MFSLICSWINGWVNNREAGDSRHHRAHYDIICIEMNVVRVRGAACERCSDPPASGQEFRRESWPWASEHYRQDSNIRRTKSQHLKDSRNVLRLSLPNFLEARCQVENEDVVGAAPTGDAPTTSEWSTILLPTKVRLILEVLRWYIECRNIGRGLLISRKGLLAVNQVLALTTNKIWNKKLEG